MSLKISKKSFVNFFFLFFLFDLLFMPNFLMSAPLSFYLYIFGGYYFSCIKRSYLIAYFLLGIILFSSILFGSSLYSGEIQGNIKRALQLMIISSLVFFNYKLIDYHAIKKWIIWIISIFYMYILVLYLLFLNEYSFYSAYMSVVYPSSMQMLDINHLNGRFSYRFEDANSFSYLILLLSVLILYSTESAVSKFTLFVTSIAIILFTLSRGGAIGIFAILVAYVFFIERIRFISYKTLAFIFISTLLVYFLYNFLYSFYEFLEAKTLLEEDIGRGIGGGRIGKWYYFFDNFNFAPFGVGYALFDEGGIFRPHSDFIRLNMSYGVLIYFIFLYFFNKFSNNFFILWIAFSFPFLINSIIDSYRLFGLFILIYLLFKSDIHVKKYIR